MMNAKRFLTENQIMVVFFGILAGLFLPGTFSLFHPLNTFLLQLIFFLSALRVNMHDLGDDVADWKMQLLSSAFKLVVLPLAVYLPLVVLAPEWALPYFVVLVVPTGMTIALVADFFGGKTSLAIVITIVTSLLAPFTIPLLSKLVVGQAVPFDAWGMLRSLAEAIILPFFVAWGFQHVAPHVVKRGQKTWRTVSVLTFGLLIASIVSKTMQGGPSNVIALTPRMLAVNFGCFLFISALLYAAYAMIPWRKPSERITVALCMLYMNNTLALYIADRYFAEQNIVPQLVIILLLLNAILPLFKFFAARMNRVGRPSRR